VNSEYTFIARQRLGKNEYASNNPVTSVAMQRRYKQAFPTTVRLFSTWSMQSGYKKEFN
jgi:hypothetical protein